MADVLVLRSSRAGALSYGDFRWPMEVGAVVEAPDWSPDPVCGYGLHGWLWGEGDGCLACSAEDAVWHVLEVDEESIVQLNGKVKFPRARVAFCGPREEAVAWLQERAPGRAVVYGTATAGYRGTATAGYRGTATAGDDGTATAGYRGTATAGDDGTATAGDRGTATAGDAGTIMLKRWDDDAERWLYVVAYVGEDGVEPNVPYRLDESGALVKAEENDG